MGQAWTGSTSPPLCQVAPTRLAERYVQSVPPILHFIDQIQRWLHSLCPTIKKSSWTPEEDHKLVELHRTYGNKWSTIARFIQGRTDDACSKRFREALDPKLKKDEWSAEEDAQLLEAQKRLGCKWRDVGEEMQRGSLACRNR